MYIEIKLQLMYVYFLNSWPSNSDKFDESLSTLDIRIHVFIKFLSMRTGNPGSVPLYSVKGIHFSFFFY